MRFTENIDCSRYFLGRLSFSTFTRRTMRSINVFHLNLQVTNNASKPPPPSGNRTMKSVNELAKNIHQSRQKRVHLL